MEMAAGLGQLIEKEQACSKLGVINEEGQLDIGGESGSPVREESEQGVSTKNRQRTALHHGFGMEEWSTHGAMLEEALVRAVELSECHGHVGRQAQALQHWTDKSRSQQVKTLSAIVRHRDPRISLQEGLLKVQGTGNLCVSCAPPCPTTKERGWGNCVEPSRCLPVAKA
jgi:hypothetical protein